jgi:hypothetical protein
MKKIVLWSFIFLAVSLYGQSKKDLPNYGYPLTPMKLEEQNLALLGAELAGHMFKTSNKLNKIADLPVSVDNTADMPPVLDQGQEGSCTAFTVAYDLGRVANKNGGYSLDNQFSPSFLFNLYQTLNSGTVFGALAVVKEAGCAKLSDCPYYAGDYTSLPDISIWKKAVIHRDVMDWSWFKVGDTLPRPSYGANPIPIPGYLGVNMAREELAKGNPVMLEFSVTAGYGGAMSTRKWMYNLKDFGSQDFTGGHAVEIVGYNDTLQTPDGRGAFRIINSWGSDKFDHGYCWITYQLMAQKEFNGNFFTYTPRNKSYEPEFTVEFNTSNFGCFFSQTAVINANGKTSSQNMWVYRGDDPDQTFLTHSLVDLTESVNSVDLSHGATLSLNGLWSSPTIWIANPVINSLHIVDKTRGIDTLINANLTITPDQLTGNYPFYNWQGYAQWSVKATITDVQSTPSTPTDYNLSQNYPNPFNPTTAINFSLPKSGNVTLKVYDLLGREVATLVSGYLPAGAHNTKFDASKLASGMYVYRLQAGTYTAVKKMLLMK